MITILKTVFRFLRRVRRVTRALWSGVHGIMLVCAVWILVLPASPQEQALLALPTADMNPTLQVHRTARLLDAVATDRMLSLVARQSGGIMTTQQVRAQIQATANGQNVQREAVAQAAPDGDTQGFDIRAGSAKFVVSQ